MLRLSKSRQTKEKKRIESVVRSEGRAGNLNKVPSDLYVNSTDSSVRTGPRSSLTSGLRKAKMRSRKTGTQAVRQTTDVSHPCRLSATSCQHLCRVSRKNRRGSLGAPSGLSGVTHARGLAVRNLRKGETAATVFCHVSLTSPGVEPAPNLHGPLKTRQPPLLIRPASAPVASDGSGSRVGRSLWAISATLPRTTSALDHHAPCAVEIRRPRRAAALGILDSRRGERQKTLGYGTRKLLP